LHRHRGRAAYPVKTQNSARQVDQGLSDGRPSLRHWALPFTLKSTFYVQSLTTATRYITSHHITSSVLKCGDPNIYHVTLRVFDWTISFGVYLVMWLY
jgi:hypothetical protein